MSVTAQPRKRSPSFTSFCVASQGQFNMLATQQKEGKAVTTVSNFFFLYGRSLINVSVAAVEKKRERENENEEVVAPSACYIFIGD